MLHGSSKAIVFSTKDQVFQKAIKNSQSSYFTGKAACKQKGLSNIVMLMKCTYMKLTYVKDFPLKTMGGATAAKIQNPR